MAKQLKAQKQNRIYFLTFEGLACVTEGSEKRTYPYKETVPISSEMLTNDPRHIFVKYHAEKILSKKFAGYVHPPATFDVTEAIAHDGEPITDIRIMTREQLEQECEDNDKLDVEVSLYMDNDSLRQAIQECLEDPAGFEKQQAKRLEIKGPELKVRRQMLDLQKLLDEHEAAKNAPPEPAKPDKALVKAGATKRKAKVSEEDDDVLDGI